MSFSGATPFGCCFLSRLSHVSTPLASNAVFIAPITFIDHEQMDRISGNNKLLTGAITGLALASPFLFHLLKRRIGSKAVVNSLLCFVGLGRQIIFTFTLVFAACYFGELLQECQRVVAR